MTENLQLLVINTNELESKMVSVERVNDYVETPSEVCVTSSTDLFDKLDSSAKYQAEYSALFIQGCQQFGLCNKLKSDVWATSFVCALVHLSFKSLTKSS